MTPVASRTTSKAQRARWRQRKGESAQAENGPQSQAVSHQFFLRSAGPFEVIRKPRRDTGLNGDAETIASSMGTSREAPQKSLNNWNVRHA
jgi:hypothetical protein